MRKFFFGAWLCLFLTLFFSAEADVTYSLRLSTTSITLSPGESRTVTWSVEPVNLVEHTVTWTSDNEFVAAVDQRGRITGRAAGSTYVHATLETGVTRRISVTVTGNAVTELRLDRDSLQLEVGESAKLNYTMNADADDKRVRWTSDDTKVATVDKEGRVTAVGGGVATITLTCVNGMTDTAIVYVPSDVKTVNLSPRSAEIGIGGQITLEAEALPINARNRALTWESSDPAIATVDDTGLVTGVAVGECRIRASNVSGAYAVMEIRVELLPESLEISPDKMILSRKNPTGSLSVNALPEGAKTDSLTWHSSDEGTVSVDGGELTAHGYGSAVITVQAKNGVSASVEVFVGETPESVRFGSNVYMVPMGGEGVNVYPVFSPYESVSAGYEIRVEDGKVAGIDENNVLFAKAVGTTTVTLTSAEGLTCSAEVRVYEDVQSLYAAQGEVTLRQYGFHTPVIRSETGKVFTGKLAVESDDESVCVFDGSRIYARSPGTATVTFRNPGTDAACSVKVTVLPNDDYPVLVLALTFDDGPGPYTRDILKVLDKYNIKATFFLLGRSIEDDPETAALYKDTPHELGNHTYDNSSVSSGSVAQTASALEKTDRLAGKWIGRELTLLRAPDALLPGSLLSSFFDTRRFVGRGYDAGDLRSDASAQSIYEYAVGRAYNTCVLTFHDAGPSTAEALEMILPELLGQGYRFLTISELIEYTGFDSGIFSTIPS